VVRQEATTPADSARTAAAAPLRFTKQDVVLCMAAAWRSPVFGERTYAFKQEQGFRFVPLVCDLIPCTWPQLWGAGFSTNFFRWAADAMWSADLVVTISQSARRDIIAFTERMHIPTPPVEVLRLGDDVAAQAIEPPADVLRRLGPDRRYVLCVGTLEARKNQVALYHAWRRLVLKHGVENMPRLVLVGKAGFLSAEMLYQAGNDPLTQDIFVHLSDISDAQLSWLYDHCLFTAYPSHFEGWGLPINESLRHGKYCIASNSSSMPEIGGDLVDYHDPLDNLTLLQLLERAIFDPVFLAGRAQRIEREYTEWTWRRCAESLKETLLENLGDGLLAHAPAEALP